MSRAFSLREHRIKVGVNESRDLVWLKGEEQIEPERLADYIVTILDGPNL